MRSGMKMMLAGEARRGQGGGGQNNYPGRGRMEQGENMRYEGGGRSEMRGGSGGENRYESMRYEGGRSEMRGESRYEGGRSEMRGEGRYEGGGRSEMRYESMNGGEMRRGGGRGRMGYPEDMRGENMRYEDMRSGGYDMEGPMEEMRRGRRRYRNGRFAPENRYYPPEYGGDEEDRYESRNREMNNYPQQRRMESPMNHIGFDGGESREGMISFPEGQRRANQRLDKETAEEWVEHMKNEDGTKGPHWTMEQTEQVRRQKGLDCDPLEFWVAMNASYSDLSKIAKKHNANTMDYYVDYVLAFWLKDKDAVPHKLAAYYDAVVKKQ